MRREIVFGLGYLRRGPLLRFVAWSVPEAAPTALLGVAVARAVDTGFLAGRPLTGLAWLGAVVLLSLASAVGSRQGLRGLGELVEPLRDDLVRRVVSGALRQGVDGKADDGAVARLTRQVEVVRDSFAGLLLVMRGFAVTVIGAMVGLLSLAPVIMMFILPPFLLGLAAFVASLGFAARRQRASVRADERLAATASAVLAGAKDVIACGAEKHAAAMVSGPIEEHAAAERALAKTAVLRTVCFAVGGWLPLLAMLAAGPWLAGRGLTAGQILGGLMYVLLGLQPALNKLMGGLGGSGLRYAITLGVLLDLQVGTPDTRRSRVKADGHELTARGVTFAYGPHSEPILRDLDLVVEDGGHLAIIGPSGIGKSTLAAVLCGLLPPSSGEVRIGGRPACGPARVLIPQEAYVFTASLRENLTYLRPRAGKTAVTAAVDAVGATELVARLGGLDAQLSPGSLSAGERQLIALARAYLSPAPVAVLDEATCHLDPAAEAVVEAAFARRPGSLVVIAHRLSSALRARQILVLDGTDAVRGDHATLLRVSPLYRELISTLSPERSGSPRSWSGYPSSS